jgi:hypothetical protein
MNRYKNVFIKDESANYLEINLDLDVFTIANTLLNLSKEHGDKHLYLSQCDDASRVYYKVPLTEAEIERSTTLEKELSTISDRASGWTTWLLNQPREHIS